MFSFYRRKNRDRIMRYLTTARQADGSAVVSPGGIIGRSYSLPENELESYLAWESQFRKRVFLLGLPIGIAFILILILLMVAYPGYDGFLLVGIGVWLFFIIRWATRPFRTRFPDAPRVRDSGKW